VSTGSFEGLWCGNASSRHATCSPTDDRGRGRGAGIATVLTRVLNDVAGRLITGTMLERASPPAPGKQPQ
jgi:hypothetical protein